MASHQNNTDVLPLYVSSVITWYHGKSALVQGGKECVHKLSLPSQIFSLFSTHMHECLLLFIQDFTKYWVIFSSNLPGEGCLHFYKSKSAVKSSIAIFVENLANMTNICQLNKDKNQCMLKISYADHLLFLLFSSLATMQQWYKRLRTFLSQCVCIYVPMCCIALWIRQMATICNS